MVVVFISFNSRRVIIVKYFLFYFFYKGLKGKYVLGMVWFDIVGRGVWKEKVKVKNR